MGIWPYYSSSIRITIILLVFQFKMGNSQSISLLTYGIDDTVLPCDRVNANLLDHMDNFIDVDDDVLYLEGNELLYIIISIIISSNKDVLCFA